MTEFNQTEQSGLQEGVRYSAGTDVGSKREENQDAFGIIEGKDFRIFIVADGMGGVKGGALASNLAIATLKNSIKTDSAPKLKQIIKAIREANSAIFRGGLSDPSVSGMGTTFVSLFLKGRSLHCINVGDSRAYRFRDGALTQLTEDHTLVRELVRSGTIKAEQAENHPVSHMLTRSLGPAPEVEIDSYRLKDTPEPGDLYLLCSDGLYNMVPEARISQILSQKSLDNAVEELINTANANGGLDNITVILFEITDGFKRSVGEDERKDEESVEDTLILDEDEIEEEIEEEVESDEQIHLKDTDQGALQDSSITDNSETEEDISPDSETADVSDDSSADDSETSLEEEIPTERAILGLPRFLVIIGAFIGGAIASAVVFPIWSSDEPAKVDISMAITPEPSTLKEEPQPDLQIEDKLPMPGVYTGARLTDSERENIKRRKEYLERYIKDLNNKLLWFDQPISGEVIIMAKEAEAREAKLKEELRKIEDTLISANRKFAVWYGRRKRLETTDPINIASEVAVSSEEVKKQKERFERATWEYLSEVEKLRFKPNDKEIERKVAELVKVRNRYIAELAEGVKKAIDKEVSESDQLLSELPLERDRIEKSLIEVRRDIEYTKILMGSNQLAKDRMKSELLHEKEISVSELDELKRIEI